MAVRQMFLIAVPFAALTALRPSHSMALSLINPPLSLSPSFPECLPLTAGVGGLVGAVFTAPGFCLFLSVPLSVSASCLPLFFPQELGFAVIWSSFSVRLVTTAFNTLSSSSCDSFIWLVSLFLFLSKRLGSKINSSQNNSPAGPFYSTLFYFLLLFTLHYWLHFFSVVSTPDPHWLLQPKGEKQRLTAKQEKWK